MSDTDNSLHQNKGVPADGEMPLLPVEALAHGLVLLQGRLAPQVRDVTDAAYFCADLAERGWTVVASPERGPDAPRLVALAACLAIQAAGPAVSAPAKPTPRMQTDAEALLNHLRSLCFELVPCGSAAP